MIRRESAPLASIAAFAVTWLLVPSVALADDCSNWSLSEVGSCPNYALFKFLGFVGGAIAAAGGWLFRQYRDAWEDTLRSYRAMTRDPFNEKPILPPYHRAGSGGYSEDDPPPGARRIDFD